MATKQDLRSRSAHAGTATPTPMASGPAVAPIYQTSVFAFDSLDQIDQVQEGLEGGFIYSRYGNPNHRGFELAVADLENAEEAACYGSGMAAISATLLCLLSSGDILVAGHELYGGTFNLLVNDLNRFGIRVVFVDPANPQEVDRALVPGTKVLYFETISNPTMKVADVEALSALARAKNVLTVVDSTFASPYLIQPLSLGADLVIHSATKYISGHSAVTGGVVAGSRELIGGIRKTGISLGAVFSPFDTWLATMGLKTLALRMERCSENALELARFLDGSPKVRHVNYPGLSGHPQFELARKIMPRGFGGMLSFEVQGGLERAARVMERLSLCRIVPSLAGVSTTTSHPAKTSHRSMPSARRAELGISDALVRVSVGIEDIHDIITDFRQALD